MKQKVNFSINIASLFNVMRDNSSVFFSWNFVWFLQKEPIILLILRISWYRRVMKKLKNNFSFKKWQELGKFWSEHSKDSKTCTLAGLCHAKCITLDLKRKKNWLVIWKMTWEIRQIFIGILLKCQNWYIHGIPLSKVQNAWAKSLQTSYV